MKARALYGTIGSLAVTALLTVPAGGTPGPTAPAAPTSSPRPAVSPSSASPSASPSPTPRPLVFGRCAPRERLPTRVQCAKLAVPLDHAHPDGKKITLTVSRARATGSPKERQGALVYNPGGPGASGMQFPLYGTLDKWRKTARAYDFVGYAPRGVGGSAPLSCQDPAAYVKAPSDYPAAPDAKFRAEKTERAAAYARGCARKTGAALRHYTSEANARDLDVLRAALGEKKLTFMGASYGTYFGALYATLFPGHVRRMVFDSVVDPDPRKIWYRNNLDQDVGFERRWSDWRRWVAKHDGIYHLGKTPRAVRASYEKARDRLRRTPAGGKVGPAQLHGALLETGYADAFWPSRAAALAAYLKGDPKPLIALAAPDPKSAKASENTNAVYLAVECNDAPWPRDVATWESDSTRVAAIAPFETWDNTWMNLPCAFWPEPGKTGERGGEDAGEPDGEHAGEFDGEKADDRRPMDVGAEPGALPPVLLLAAERDAATPYGGAQELQRRLPSASLVTEQEAGSHGLAFGENDCVNRHTETYLLTGRAPDRHTFCAPHPEPVPEKPAGATEPNKTAK
ncbi:alpha/beta hydrolase [Streptomyces sp. NPDC003077]|uniref:alpha/beta hydrolase n=1 Tax=Streptomyces sp. NPDC003077 TaxID=3154443 RepID=UPI0033B57ACA